MNSLPLFSIKYRQKHDSVNKTNQLANSLFRLCRVHIGTQLVQRTSACLTYLTNCSPIKPSAKQSRKTARASDMRPRCFPFLSLQLSVKQIQKLLLLSPPCSVHSLLNKLWLNNNNSCDPHSLIFFGLANNY